MELRSTLNLRHCVIPNLKQTATVHSKPERIKPWPKFTLEVMVTISLVGIISVGFIMSDITLIKITVLIKNNK